MGETTPRLVNSTAITWRKREKTYGRINESLMLRSDGLEDARPRDVEVLRKQVERKRT